MDKIEYLYLSRLEQKRIVQNKAGFRFKLLLTKTARETFRNDLKRWITEMLNDLGVDGWELVSSIPITVFGNSLGCDMIFKRVVRE